MKPAPATEYTLLHEQRLRVLLQDTLDSLSHHDVVGQRAGRIEVRQRISVSSDPVQL
jgi:hypothetical protein